MTYVVTYIIVDFNHEGARAGGSGSTRMTLEELVPWLANRPGTLIVSITEL